MWEGSLHNGLPALNLRYVTRSIYQWERGPIPPGMTLWRNDHKWYCRDMESCRHNECVNPYHFDLLPKSNGLYRRERNWDGTTTEHTLHYLHNERKKGRQKRGSGGDSQGLDAPKGD
jgi:hypothetical protein